jgi:hypothetical protein
VLSEAISQAKDIEYEFAHDGCIDDFEDSLYDEDPLWTIESRVETMRLVAASATAVADALAVFYEGFRDFAENAMVDEEDPDFDDDVELFRLPHRSKKSTVGKAQPKSKQ